MFYAESTRVNSDEAVKTTRARICTKITEPLQEVEAPDHLCTKKCERGIVSYKRGVSKHEAVALQYRTRIRTILGGPWMLLLSLNRN
jgi:hypothetical protein